MRIEAYTHYDAWLPRALLLMAYHATLVTASIAFGPDDVIRGQAGYREEILKISHTIINIIGATASEQTPLVDG